MDEADPEKYMEFLTSDWSTTKFIEFRLDQKLISVAVVDELDNGLSAVYTFFDPDYVTRSPGVYCILWEIEYARTMNLPYLYLGYWIQECEKMSYKNQYQPLEQFHEGKWSRV
jgi:arginine-tRNA-protein transferase